MPPLNRDAALGIGRCLPGKHDFSRKQRAPGGGGRATLGRSNSVLAMKGFPELLSDIGAGLDSGTLSLPGASLRVAEHVQGQLQCSRVSLWAVESQSGPRVMRRLAGFDGASRIPITEPLVIGGPNLDDYFDTLIGQGIYASHDAWADPRLQAMVASYLVPNDIRSSLYAAIGVNGSTWGVLCCTQLGQTRQWTPNEVRLLKRFADAISVRRARRRRREAEAQSLMQRLLHPHLQASDTTAS
jgi:GAF domain-containing protein